MSFQQGLSGLNSSAKNLDVIGNNIANSNTVGFKGSRTEFADIYASSFSSARNIAGIGTRVANISQQFGQGNITATNNPLDVAITGNGFYRMTDASGSINYSRNGQFQIDRDGYIVNSSGLQLTGWGTDPASGLLLKGGQPVPLQLTVGNVGARATGGSGTASSGLNMILNLNASKPIIDRSAPPTGVGALNVSDPATFTNSTSATVYDSLGVSHTLSFYFTKVANNQWEVQTSFDGAAPVHTGDPTGVTPGYLMFTTSGALDAVTVPAGGANVANFAYQSPAGAVGGATDPLAFNTGFTSSTQFGSPFGVNSIAQDGYADGVLTGISISDDGTILGRYSNSQTETIGQIVLANFANPQGLQPLGNNLWAQSFASGDPRVGDPGTSDLGTLQAAAVEDSNVDMTAELVNLITAQRAYQANAQTIKAQDTVLQTLVNLR